MTDLPLDGLKVVDCATLFAGPVVASIMSDFGADVIKVEHPRGDNLRRMGWLKNGVSLWWALASRNKRCITLDLSHPEGQRLLKEVLADADVLVENFRPGTLERWGLGPEDLQQINPGLVIVRTTAFGQTGPYSTRPGFGTLAEAISGFAHINGWKDRPPALPPFALGDGVAALTGAFAVMYALWWREHGGQGKGQVIDLSLYEPLFWILGPQVTAYQQLGVVQERTGNSSPLSAPRGGYRTKDGRWLALSASSDSIATRIAQIIGREDLLNEPWFVRNEGRLAHSEELDEIIQGWIGDRTADEVLAAFVDGEAAIIPMYTIEDIVSDPHFIARNTILEIDHPKLGPIMMQDVIPRLSETPGRVAFPGPELGAHNREILGDSIGLTEADLARLRADGVI